MASLSGAFSEALSGMFRRSASLALPHLKSFAAIPSVSPVQLGHTNRSVFLSHESQREIALVLALSRPSPYYQQGEVGQEKWACVSQRLCFLTFRGPLASHDSNSYPNRSRIARYNATKLRLWRVLMVSTSENSRRPWPLHISVTFLAGHGEICPLSMGLSLCKPLGVRAICRACCHVRCRRGSVLDLNPFA